MPASTPAETADRVRAQRALVARLSQRVQRTLAGTPDAAVKALAAPAPVVDDRFVTVVFSSCAPTSGTGAVRVLAAVLEGEPLALDYAVTNDDDVNVTGSVLLDPDIGEDGIADITVPDLARGSYRVDFFDAGGSEAVASQPIDVLACVTAEVSCQAIAFSNPSVNPAVEVVYFDTDDEDDDEESVTLLPGETSRVRTQLTDLSWVAGLPSSEDEENDFPLAFAGAGEGDLTIDQDCAIDVMTTATVGCSTAGGAADIQFHVVHPADQGIRYQIVERGDDVLAAGEFAAGGKAYDDFSATAPRADEYQYSLYLDDDRNAFEKVRFTALTCVTTKVSCEAASFTNPSGNPAITVSFGTGPDALVNQLQVASGRSASTAWHQSVLAWNAYPTAAGPFVESARGLSARQLTVPQHCSAVSNGPAPVSNSVGALAATGPTPAAPFGLLGGVVLLLTGGLILGRRRRVS